MMKMSDNNMLKRWACLSDYEEQGSDPAYVASNIHSLLSELVECGGCSELTQEQERLLFGFEVNTDYGAEEGFYFVHCLDLHSVHVDRSRFDIVSDLDSYFMESVKVNGISFLDRWFDHIQN